jgi:hypothetical protein
VKIVIQNPQDLSFLTELRQWSPHLRDAMTFENFRIALDFCSRQKLGKVQVVLQAEDELGNSLPTMPLPPEVPLLRGAVAMPPA